MSITTTKPENEDELGRFTAVTREISGSTVINIHRRPIVPGRFENGVWVDTDLSGETEMIRVFARSLWTPEVVAAYREGEMARIAQEEAQRQAAEAQAKRHLPKWKFWATLDLAGKSNAVRTAVDGISDAQRRAVVKARLEHTETYDRDDPLFADPELLAALGMTTADVDALWAQANAL